LQDLVHIIRGCAENDYKYQKIVYEHYYGFSLKTVFRYIYHYDKAVHVVNDGFIKAFKHFESFKIEDGEHAEKILMGWLKRIMINTAIDELRKNKMLPEIGGIPDHVFNLPDHGQEADRLILYKELIVMIKELPPSYRTIFNLYVLDGYSHIEIAEMLNIAIGTSKSGLSRARALLQQSIRKLEEVNYAE
jgi:RNA polymerase sigma factor (sigma-70 family)